MAQAGIYHGGIVFLGEDDRELDRFCRIVSATLEDYGHPVERQSVLDKHQARVVSSRYMVKLALDERRYRAQTPELAAVGNKRRHRLEIELTAVSSDFEDRDISELMLVVMLYRMVDICNTEQIEWMDPGTILTLDQFLSAFTNVSPHRVRGHREVLDARGARFAPVDETAPHLDDQLDAITGTVTGDVPHHGIEGIQVLGDDEALARAFREAGGTDGEAGLTKEEKAQNDIRRLAAWGLTGMVAFMSAPVAASMAAVNLARGEDFRLNTQVLSLTGLLVVLQSSGTLASVISHLPL